MKHGVLGTGMVGTTIATRLVELGHDVKLGARDAANDKAIAWADGAGARASNGTFADAAAASEIIWNCTNGAASLDALGAAGAANLRGKVIVDVSNPLDFSRGMPPSLFTPSDDSLAERIQRAFPDARVVKALNTINCKVMVDPARLPGEHVTFVCGDDAAAKASVRELLVAFGWKAIIDLGGVATARGPEQYLPLWLRMWGALGTGDFNIAIARAAP